MDLPRDGLQNYKTSVVVIMCHNLPLCSMQYDLNSIMDQIATIQGNIADVAIGTPGKVMTLKFNGSPQYLSIGLAMVNLRCPLASLQIFEWGRHHQKQKLDICCARERQMHTIPSCRVCFPPNQNMQLTTLPWPGKDVHVPCQGISIVSIHRPHISRV